MSLRWLVVQAVNAALGQIQQTIEADIHTYLPYLATQRDGGLAGLSLSTGNRRLTF